MNLKPMCVAAMENHDSYYTGDCKATGSAEATTDFGKIDELPVRD